MAGQVAVDMAAISERIIQAEQSEDLSSRITAYDQALAQPTMSQESREEIVSKKAECLLKLTRYEEVTILYTTHPPSSDRNHYYAGLAQAKQGQYSAALQSWAAITEKHPQFVQQCQKLVPFVYRELHPMPAGQAHLDAYQNIQTLLAGTTESDWQPYLSALLNQAGNFLWQEERYIELLDLLPSLHGSLSAPLLGMYARLCFKLAEQDDRYLEKAILFWLTAIHSTSLLKSLYVWQQNPDMDLIQLRKQLWHPLERLVANKKKLPPRLMTVWQLESQTIRTLATWPNMEGQPTFFPCTPGFAILFQQSAHALRYLQENRLSLDVGGEEYQKICSHYSPWSPNLIPVEQGEETAAMASLTAEDKGGLADYCQQRIYWNCGLDALKRGKKIAKKHLLNALPLMKSYRTYVDELVLFAFSDLEVEACLGLAEVLEQLHDHFKDERYCEATAHVMGLKAAHMFNNQQESSAIMAVLDLAQAIYPSSVMVKAVRQQARRQVIFDQLGQALHSHDLGKAVTILQEDPDPEAREYFYETMKKWSEDVKPWKKREQQQALEKFHGPCQILNPDHPVTQAIGQSLQTLEQT